MVQYALDRLVKIHFDRAGIGMPQQAMQISPRAVPQEEQAPPSVPGGCRPQGLSGQKGRHVLSVGAYCPSAGKQANHVDATDGGRTAA